MTVSAQKSGFGPVIARLIYLCFAVFVGLIILIAVWLTAAAAYENVKFIHSTDQILFLIETARSDATADAGFGRGTGEDLIDDFVRRGQLPGPPVDGWNGQLRAQVPIPPFMRIEADVPVPACRRLVYFFSKDANTLELQKIEAREEKNKWEIVYDNGAGGKGPDSRSVNAACGDGAYATIALTLRLR